MKQVYLVLVFNTYADAEFHVGTQHLATAEPSSRPFKTSVPFSAYEVDIHPIDPIVRNSSGQFMVLSQYDSV